jgi:hypothetical protein
MPTATKSATVAKPRTKASQAKSKGAKSKGAKGKGAKGKGAKASANGAANLVKFEAARLSVLKALVKGRKTRTELKEVAPFSNYTSLMDRLEKEGVLKEVKHEDDAVVHAEITAAGRAAAKHGSKG